MKLKTLGIRLALCGLLSLGSARAAVSINNGGFETGDFTGWLLSGASSLTSVDDGTSTLFWPHNGSYYALFGDQNTETIAQPVTAQAGQIYELNFWVNDKYAGSDLLVKWGSTTLLHLDNSYTSGQVNNGWVDFDFLFQATSASVLSFSVSTGTAMGLDDVTLAAVPETNLYGLFAGLAALGSGSLYCRRLVGKRTA